MFALLTGVSGAWAQSYFATAPTQVTSITSGNYYVIDGLNQANGGTAGHFLFDNGTKVTSNNPQALPTDWTAGKFIWKIVGNSTDGYTLQNLQTGKYMSLGSSNGSAISTSSTPQTNGIHFGANNYATIRNSNGQAIDIGANGNNPTTWSGTTTPDGSRRLVIYEVDVVEIAEDACYTIAFNAKTSGNTWGLKSGTTEASPSANATGDVYVAHSYTNSSGNKRWIFVNNSDGTYLAYHGQANSAFDMSNAINEWSIASLTAGSGNVSADANCAGKVCITNDKRYTDNASAGCYIVKEANGAYDNSTAPYYNGSFTSALTFTATGGAVSSAATLAIAKFEALQTLKAYKEGNVHMPALFPTDAVAEQESTIATAINAATTTSEVATALDALYRIAEGRKFYAEPSTAAGHYMSIGTSQITATSTSLTPMDVMELVYAGDGKYYLKGVKSGYYAGNPNSGGANPGTHATTESAQALYVGNYNNTTDNQVYFARTTEGSAEAIHYNSGYTGSVVAWSYSAGASHWNVTAISDADYAALCADYSDVTYNVVIEASGTVKATATSLDKRGSAVALPSSLTRDYCTYTYYSDAACQNQLTTVPDAATSTVYALATYTMPFTVSTDFANATWYYVNAHATYNNRYISTNGDAIVWAVGNGRTDAYKWAFIGNPYDGFQIINKAAGATKCLQETDALTMGTTAKAWPVRKQTTTSWQSGANGFGFWSDANSKYVNAQSGTLKYWGSFDQGSTYWVSEVTPVEVGNLSNSKKYRITCNRGGLSTYIDGEGDTYLASPIKTSLDVSAKDFAIINFNSKYYLYSVDDEKFVTYQSEQIAPLAATISGTSDAVSFSQTTSPMYVIRFDNDANKNINSSASYTYGVVINNWGSYQSDWDDGCQYIIEEVGDFDATDAIAALSGYMIESYYDSEKQHNVMSAGKVGYPKTDKTTYTNLLGHIQTLNAYDHVYTESDYTTLVSLYEAYVAESDVVLPTAGKFYRFKGAQSGKYLKGENSGTSDRLLNTAGEEGAKSIFYLDASSHLLGYSTGQYVQYTSQIAAVGAEEMNTFEFEAPKTAFGALSIKASPSGNNNGRYLYSHTGTENYANRNGGKADETDWYIEEVTALPVSTTSNIRYATFCSPVEVSIPGQDTPIYDMSDPSNPVQTGEYDEVTAFQAKIDGDDVKLVSIDDGVIPANFPVVLKMHFSNAEIEAEEPMSKTRNLPINYGAATHTAADYHSNALEGTIAAITVGSPIYTLQYNETSGTVGFYRKNSGTLKGFKAYLSAPNGARFQGFSFEELTGISAIIPGRITIENAYDLQGRRAGEVKKGVYIVNGKKVLF